MIKVINIGKMLAAGLVCAGLLFLVTPAMGMGLSFPGGSGGGSEEPEPIITPLGSFSLDQGSPARVAVDKTGTVYVTDPSTKRILVYANNGVLLKTIGSVQSPLGIAVNADGQLIISDTADNYVGIFTADGKLISKLGIAVTATRIYVTDSINNVVVMYDKFRSRIDGIPFGNGIPFGEGLLEYPTGITVDETKGEVFVIDHGNRFVRIFDLDGNYLKGVDIYLTHLRPLGIMVGDGRMYLTDTYHSMVSVYEYDGATDTYSFVKKFGIYGNGTGELKTPTDGADDRDHKLFVANTNNQRIEVFGIGSFTGLQIMPNTVTVSGYSNGSSVTQSVDITSTGDQTDWTATETSSWISLSATSGSTPSTIDVTVNPTVSAGNYTAEVRFATPSRTQSVLLVHLNIESNNVTLSVIPDDLALVYQKGSDVLPAAELSVSSSGSAVDWHASHNSDWLTLDTTSGTTPDTITVSANSLIKRLSSGSHDAEISVDSNTANGVPVNVAVHIDIIEAGNITVTTNLDEAAFTLTGPENFGGTGTEWSAEDVPPGTYTIMFEDVDGYIKPASKIFTISSGEQETIAGIYREQPGLTHVIAGSGDTKGNVLNVLSLDGILELSIVPFNEPAAVKVGSGDMDGDGIDEIIATNGKDTITVFNAEGIELATHSLSRTGRTITYEADALEITVTDYDNDGKAEIMAGYIFSKLNITEIAAYGLAGPSLPREVILFSKNSTEPFTIASGDIDGNGSSDLLVATSSLLSAYAMNSEGRSSLTLLWTKTLYEQAPPSIATGYVNDDSSAEICYGAGPASTADARVTCLNGDGTAYGLEITAFGDLGYQYGATVAVGDVDSDGLAEIGIGAGPGPGNEALIRLYASDGGYIDTITTMNSYYGVNISFGSFGN
jgi:hypothetical protein